MWQWISSIRRWFSVKLRRFLGDKDIRGIADQAVEQTTNAIKRISGRLNDGQITLDQWRDQVAEEILDGHVQQYLLGRGGIQSMTDADWREVDKLVDRQYQFLEGFYKDIKEGKVAGSIVNRAALYGLAVGQAYFRAVAEGAKGLKKESRWLMSPDKEHCPTCLQYAGLSWQKIGVLPIPLSAEANTECLSRCGCYLEYR